jgi:tRNA(Ile)-lysidine synthase
MIHLVKAYLQENDMPSAPSTIIVGVSGGADSVALLIVLKELGYTCVVAHCNFHLRENEADADERFVIQLCHEHQCECEIQHFDTRKYAVEKKISIEMAARDLRYAWFEELRKTYQAAAIAIAHHLNDSVETVLINLINGTGIQGITGIKPKNGYIMRPLLCVNRKQIEDFLSEKKLHYVTDSSNLENVYTRNKIRNVLIPEIEKINESFFNTMVTNIQNFNVAASIYNKYISDKLHHLVEYSNETNFRISISHLLKEEHAATLLYEALKSSNFSPKTCNSIHTNLPSNSGKEYVSSTHRLLIDREFLFISPIEEKDATDSFTIQPSCTQINSPIQLRIETLANDEHFQLSKAPTCANIDNACVSYPLIIRKWKHGDIFSPLGMKKKKKVSDFFIDEKLTKWEKENCWILESNGDIVWIIGYRLDNRYKITKSTAQVLKITILQ